MFEAWSNLYYRFGMVMEATNAGDSETLVKLRYPDVHPSIEGVRWVENCVRSADAGAVWVVYI